MIFVLYFSLIFFFFDIVIIYHVQLYFFTLIYFTYKLLVKKTFSNGFFILYYIVFFWGFSLSISFCFNFFLLKYFFIINGCLDLPVFSINKFHI